MAIMSTAGKMMSMLCQKCHEIFAIPARRGRPPKFCERCHKGDLVPSYDEESARVRLEMANKRVDNLEMLLRSRGMHISQHPER